MKEANFKARGFDKSKYAVKSKLKSIEGDKKPATSRVQTAPFNFSTDERSKSRMRKSIGSSESKETETHFKATKMPNYKFFEPKKTDTNIQKTTKVDEFNFKTTERSLQKQNSLKSLQSTESTDSKEFKARKMPDFTC